MSDDIQRLIDMSKQLRGMANDLDGYIQECLNGNDDRKYQAVGDVVEGRKVEDIEENDMAHAAKLIKVTIG